MATIVKGMKELEDIILEKAGRSALQATQQIVYDCIQESITEYYNEKVFSNKTSNTPEIYERTFRLMHALVKTNIVRIGNTIQCEVKIDDSYLTYQYPGTEGWDGVSATGLDVLTWNEENGSHGGTVDGDWKIWDEAMRTLGGETGIMTILTSNLKKAGLNIK